MEWHNVNTTEIPTKTKLIVRVVISYSIQNDLYWNEEFYLTAIYDNIGHTKWDFLGGLDVLKIEGNSKNKLYREDVTHFLIPKTVQS